MKSDVNPPVVAGGDSAKALVRVLGQSEHIKDLVEECAEELSSVNSDLKQGISDQDSLPKVEQALEKSEIVEDKVQVASDKLSVVNRALKTEIQERHVLENKLAIVTRQKDVARHAALHDPLTGLPNRALFNDRLELGLAQAARHGWNLAVLFIDLDKFKEVNDTHGHAAGDSVLQAIAGRLRANSRGGDTVSRVGGDEFLYLVMETGAERDVTMIANKIITALEAPCAIAMDANVDPDAGNERNTLSASIRASIGISIFPRDGSTADALIARADQAMYRAKQQQTGFAYAD